MSEKTRSVLRAEFEMEFMDGGVYGNCTIASILLCLELYRLTRGLAHEIHVRVRSLGLACDKGHLPQLPTADPTPCRHPPLVLCLPSSDECLMARGRA